MMHAKDRIRSSKIDTSWNVLKSIRCAKRAFDTLHLLTVDRSPSHPTFYEALENAGSHVLLTSYITILCMLP